MTPTLMGRWQTRFLLFGTVGVLVTLIFGRIYQDHMTLLAVLSYLLLIGFLWDILYNYLQSWRWDQDWPPLFQLFCGIVEGMFIWILMLLWEQFHWFGSPHLPCVAPELTFALFVAHYIIVWLMIFVATQGLLRIIFPRWRYHGGQWI